MTGVVLAGGTSVRMGMPKCGLILGGRTMLERAVQRMLRLSPLVVVAGSAGVAIPSGVRVVQDARSGTGPLGGIHAALLASRDDCAVVACDMPFFSIELLEYMADESRGKDAAVVRIGEYWEPLHAIYRPGCLPAIESLLHKTVSQGSASGSSYAADTRQPRVAELFGMVTVRSITEEEVSMFSDPSEIFFNINSPEDYLKAKSMSSSPGDRSLNDEVCGGP